MNRSPKLRVSRDWNTQLEALLFYEGPAWYQRYFSYQKHAHIRTILYSGAANYQARVSLNGNKVGEHIGGFTPFDFEVTNQVADGECCGRSGQCEALGRSSVLTILIGGTTVG